MNAVNHIKCNENGGDCAEQGASIVRRVEQEILIAAMVAVPVALEVQAIGQVVLAIEAQVDDGHRIEATVPRIASGLVPFVVRHF